MGSVQGNRSCKLSIALAPPLYLAVESSEVIQAPVPFRLKICPLRDQSFLTRPMPQTEALEKQTHVNDRFQIEGLHMSNGIFMRTRQKRDAPLWSETLQNEMQACKTR